MTELIERHRPTLDAALQAAAKRGLWFAYPEVPRGKIYGETAKTDGVAAFRARLGPLFVLADHPSEGAVGAEVLPYGSALGITCPAASVDMLVSASRAAAMQRAMSWRRTHHHVRTRCRTDRGRTHPRPLPGNMRP